MSAALALDALGHPTRREILRVLGAGPQPVGALAAELPVSRPAVSQHLRILEDAALVTHHRDGRRHVYRIDPTGFISARAWLQQFWIEALDTFAELAEATAPSAQEPTP
jgi:DNA-binding transcriptional ArsR family regulator